MRLLLLFSALLAATLSGCVIKHPGSQPIEIGPGYIRPANSGAMWEATGDEHWRYTR